MLMRDGVPSLGHVWSHAHSGGTSDHPPWCLPVYHSCDFLGCSLCVKMTFLNCICVFKGVWWGSFSPIEELSYLNWKRLSCVPRFGPHALTKTKVQVNDVSTGWGQSETWTSDSEITPKVMNNCTECCLHWDWKAVAGTIIVHNLY